MLNFIYSSPFSCLPTVIASRATPVIARLDTAISYWWIPASKQGQQRKPLSAGMTPCCARAARFFQYKNPKSQRGILRSVPNSISSARIKESGISFICFRFLFLPPTSKVIFLSTRKSLCSENRTS